ncbi:MAG: tRNA (adenosine(37)-N6)-threonylcarbamoyltransferase complex ATPase subunit type 1 TsaE [Verrucomicrobiae bacterium]|nr:tRNA (adenosine(37)-N6)-threonylcarbamoyltransferase complex ATPase subunit type 1 TsaE [Verrucomicrobiae bacterium]
MTISENPRTETVETHSLEETSALGRRLASMLRPGDVVALDGELGAGKTALVKAIAAALGCTQSVTSPTFTIIHEYETILSVFHIDLYRLNTEQEAIDVGIEEYLRGDGVCLVEWAERIERLLPRRTISIRIEVLSETSRRFAIRQPC